MNININHDTHESNLQSSTNNVHGQIGDRMYGEGTRL